MRFAGSVMIRCAKRDALRSFSEGGPVYYVYLIESLSAQEERHVGMTTDLKQRLREHDQGKSSHTTKFSPWKLITYVAFTDRAKAEAFERYLKSGSGHAFARKRLLATQSFSRVDLFKAPSQWRAASTSSLVRPCPAFAKRIVTSAPARRRSSTRR